MSSDRFGGLPKKGDLIEASSSHYKHWFLYVGDGYVVHMKDLESAGSVSGTTIRAVVRKELLPEQDGGYKHRINNKYDLKMAPLCAEEIVRRAERMVGKEIHYGITDYNSEHFVTEMRYGVPMCDQVNGSKAESLQERIQTRLREKQVNDKGLFATLALVVIRLVFQGSRMPSSH